MNDRLLALSVPGLPEGVPADKTLAGHDAAGTLHWLQNTTSNGPGPLPKQGEVRRALAALLAAEQTPDTTAAVTQQLHPVLLSLLDDPPDPAIVGIAAEVAALGPSVLALADFLGGTDVPPGLRMPKLNAVFWPIAAFDAACAGQPAMPPSLRPGGRVVATRWLPVPLWENVLLCREEDGLVWMAAATRRQSEAFIFLPQARICLSGPMPAPSDDAKKRLIGTVFDLLLRNAAELASRSLWRPARVGLLVARAPHVGHAIFNEMQAIDRALSERPRWAASPVFYVPKTFSGMYLYAEPAEIYPDAKRLFFSFDRLGDAASYSLRQGVQLHAMSRSKALRATRERLMALAARHGAATGLAAKAETLLGTGETRLPCLVLGLRLIDRHPMDFLGLLLRLTRQLVQELGGMVVVLDGINSAAEHEGTLIRKGSFRAGLQAERAFAADYMAGVADLPVQVVNCVGVPLADNLFWLSQADYFVAPNGAGLAKLRWAQDVPGFVLTSRINLDQCRMVALYAEPALTEPPFSPMHLTTAEEVEDVPPEPPRAAPPGPVNQPYPDRFVVDEERVFPRISALFRDTLAMRSGGSPPRTPWGILSHSVTERDGKLFIQRGGREQVVIDRKGRPVQSSPGWVPARLLDMEMGLSLLLFAHNDGRCAGWILRDGHVLMGDYFKVPKAQPFFLRKEIEKTLLLTVSDTLRGLDSQSLDRNTLQIVARLVECKPLSKTQPLVNLLVSEQIITEFVNGILKWKISFIDGAADLFALPAVFSEQLGMQYARLIPLSPDFRALAILCWGKKPNEQFIVISDARDRKENQPPILVFRVSDGVVFTFGRVEGREELINELFRSVFSTIVNFADNPAALKRVERAGILLAGKPHFGHGIWDELQAVERLIEVKSKWVAAPTVYVLKSFSGAALYGDLDDLYPELKGRFRYVETHEEAVQDALANGVQLFQINGQRALRRTRDRLIALAARQGEINGLRRIAEAQFGHGNSRLPVLVLGLRLVNRYPVNFVGFYFHLLKSLTERFGPIGVVIDGLNSASGVERSTLKIFNGNKRGHDLSYEMIKETEFVGAIQNMAIRLPVTFISCVGYPIRDNLYFLSIADFFVAPFGAGAAKLRWALDIPGYLLVSEANLVHCSLLNVYDSSLNMDEPFTRLHMNTAADVKDDPAGPPRAGAVLSSVVPHPENFYLDEPAVIAQICAAMQASLDVGAKERGKIASTRPS